MARRLLTQGQQGQRAIGSWQPPVADPGLHEAAKNRRMWHPSVCRNIYEVRSPALERRKTPLGGGNQSTEKNDPPTSAIDPKQTFTLRIPGPSRGQHVPLVRVGVIGGLASVIDNHLSAAPRSPAL